MISEGSCDTKDRSNGCWKFSFAITGINIFLKYIKNRKQLFYIVMMFHNIMVFNCNFNQIIAALMSKKGLKTFQNLTNLKFYIELVV